MGNMSNPSINRWGLSLFWYRYWINDKIMQQNIQQDDIFVKLIYFYLLYGTCFPQNIFINKYWYGQHYFKINTNQFLYNERYFRYLEVTNKILNEKSIQKLRVETRHLFYSKLWVLRYQKWLIISFYTFQPIIGKKNTLKRQKVVNFYLSNDTHVKNKFKRIKFFFFLTLNELKKFKNVDYKF